MSLKYLVISIKFQKAPETFLAVTRWDFKKLWSKALQHFRRYSNGTSGILQRILKCPNFGTHTLLCPPSATAADITPPAVLLLTQPSNALSLSCYFIRSLNKSLKVFSFSRENR